MTATRRKQVAHIAPGWVWDGVSNLDYIHAAHVLGVPVGWLKEKVPALGLPHGRYGKHVLFTPDDIAEIRRMHHVAATQPQTQTLVQVVSDPEVIRLALMADECRRAA